jgi:uncharacterized protein YgiM (DUF1202 family)
MKTTFLPVLLLALAALWTTSSGLASEQPDLDALGEALETAPAATLASAELQPGPARVAGDNVNVRAKATINSEVITQVQDGDEVFVEQVILRPEAQGKDPARWAQITYPTSASAWVHSLYVDAETGAVKPRKLNVRAGPGENYTVVGELRSGDTVAQLGVKGDWLLVQPPEGTTAYIAAKLLRQEPVVEEVLVADTEVVETNDLELIEGQPAVTESNEVAAVEQGVDSVEDPEGSEESTDLAQLPEVAPILEAIPADPLPPRIVSREGIVRTYTQPHAPSHYRLVSADNGRLINYLYTTSTNLDLGRYVGLHIIASGEESLDERWNTPVLTLKKIVLVDFEP